MFALMCAPALAEPPPQVAESPRVLPSPRPPLPSESNTASDDDFIEFLGEDDVGDPDLWDYLKKSVSAARPSSVPPPPESKP